MITTGVNGRAWRASVTPWGAVEPWDGSPRLDWYVAADDRWHVPAREAAVRQLRVEGTAVVETRLRIPNGDAVQRVWSVADGPGFTIVEVTNESTMPIAVAFDRADIRTEREVADVPIQGIDLPAGSFVLPVGHRASVRVGLAHDGPGAGRLPAGLPGSDQVARGWSALVARASRVDVPEPLLAEALVAHRCDLALGDLAHGEDDPAAFAVGLGELVRLGDDPDPWLPELVGVVEALAPVPGWEADVALAAARRVLTAAGEDRAVRDLDRIVAGRGAPAAWPTTAPDDVLVVPWLEGRLARDGRLLPEGIPSAWLGQGFEAHELPVGPSSAVSFGVRWHGARPAVLWEQHGPPVELTAPAVDPTWRTSDVRGEALWAEPPGAAPESDASDVPSAATDPVVPNHDDVSFS